MDRFDRIFKLHQVLSSSRYPVSGRRLQEEMECSRATVCRTIRDMKNYLGAPIVYYRKYNGYRYDTSADTQFELPGLWFNYSEICALLACQQLLSNVQPGLLDAHIGPLGERIKKILETGDLAKGNVGQKFRILKMTFREYQPEIFRAIASATVQAKRLQIDYHGRARNSKTKREISPQRMVYYRDNWYLDAFCHSSDELRSFAVDRIDKFTAVKKKAKEVSEPKLNQYYAESYGIFAGKPDKTAVLRFSTDVSKWVAKEKWHPQQKSRIVDDEYELEIPYSDPSELILDIMKYGPDVTVLSPKSLVNSVRLRLKQAAENYRDK